MTRILKLWSEENNMARIIVDSSIIMASLVIIGKSFGLHANIIIESDGKNDLFITTDGAIMGIFKSPSQTGDAVKMAIPSPAFARIDKKGPVVIDMTEKEATITQNGATFTAPCYAVPFYWRRAIPETYSGQHAKLDPTLIYQFVKVSKLLGIRNGRPVVIPNGEKAASIKIGDNFLGIVMPYTSDDDGYKTVPEWLGPSH